MSGAAESAHGSFFGRAFSCSICLSRLATWTFAVHLGFDKFVSIETLLSQSLMRSQTAKAVFISISLVLEACSSKPAEPSGPPAQPKPVVQALSPPQRLLRASMVLLGKRPSLLEYQAVQHEPQSFEAILDRYLESEAFGASIRQHFTEWLELDQAPDTYPAGFPATGALADLGTHKLNSSIIEAPGRLAEYIVMNDRPFTEVVTADFTLADATVATVWGLPYDFAQGGWQVTEYVDGRPKAGVLSDGWVFTRMPSTENNRHRERASLIANTFVCHDYANRPVKVPQGIDLTSESAIANAVDNNPVCVGCHHTLDPLASFFTSHYALRIPELETQYPLVQYTPDAGEGYRPPAWYGVPAENLEQLGVLIADDPRFSACFVRRFYSELMHVPLEAVPTEAITKYLPAFSQFNVKALVKAIVTSEEFAAHTLKDSSVPLDVGLRRATPQQLDTMFQALIGYQWRTDVPFDIGSGQVGAVPLMRDYLWGYRTLAGGPNNFDTIHHLRTADPTTLLALRALAERSARHVVAHDFSTVDEAYILTDKDAQEGAPEALGRQISALHLRLYGEDVAPDSPQVQSGVALWTAVNVASRSAERAWQVLLAAMFQDPRILFY